MTTRKLILGSFCYLALTMITTLEAVEIERVDYRLKDWKSVHFDDEARATSFMKTFKSLHIECKRAAHGDHIDVSYRCPKWQTLTFKTHSVAHQWQNYLDKVGFETKHAH